MEQLNLTLTLNKNGSITASWDAVPNVVRYHAYMVIRKKGTIYNETNLTTTSYTSRSGLEANQTYSVVVVAYSSSSVITSDGAELLIRSEFYNNVPLDVPQNITAAAGPVSVDISFDKVVRASGYDILLNGTIYSITSNLSRVTKKINGLIPKTKYFYAVRAKNYYRTGEYSTEQTFITPAVSPAAPTGVTKSVTQNSVTISWNPVQTAATYNIVFNGTKYTIGTTSRTFTGLYPGTSYPFKIRGVNPDADGTYTHEMTATTAPQVPTGISTVSTDTTFTISWNAMQGAASYFIYFKEQEIAVPGTENSATFTNLTPNTSYTYKICAGSVDGRSPYSAEMTIKTAPAAPDNLSGTSTKDTVTISWEPVPGATSYDLLFDGTTYRVAGTSKIIKGLVSGQSYSYQIRSNNEDGSSTYSPPKTITTFSPAFGTPINIRASAAISSVTISWDKVPGAIGYDVLIDNWMFDSVTETTMTRTGMIANTVYNYQVRARSESVTSAYSAKQTIKTMELTEPLEVPANIWATSTADSITINWDAVKHANRYKVLFRNAYYEPSETTITFTGLEPDTSYSYKIRTMNGETVSEFSEEMYVRTLPLLPPETPSNIRSTATVNSAAVSWDAVSEAASYDLLFDGVIYRVTENTKIIEGLTPGRSYSYQVRSNNAGGSSTYSEPEAVNIPPEAFGIPGNIRAGATTNSVTVSWDEVPGAVGYDVLINNIFFDSVAETTMTRTGLAANTAYKYQVRARSESAASAYSARQTIKTMELTEPLEVPANIWATSTADSITINWDAVKHANRYKVLFRNAYYEPSETTITFTGLEPDTSYSYKIRTMNGETVSEFSEEMYVRTLPLLPPETPSNIRSTATVNSAAVSWDAVSEAASYDLLFDGVIYRVTENTKIIEGLTPGRSYSYQVRSNNAGGSSTYSEPEAVNIPPEAFGIPGNIRAGATTNSVTVSWDEVPGAVGYDVLINNIFFDSVAETTMTRTGLAANTAYKYQVRARSESVTSAYSARQTIKTLELTEPLEAPSNIWATSTADSVTINWDEAENASRYEVLFRNAYYMPSMTTITFTGLEPDTTYSYQIRTMNGETVSDFSEEMYVRTLAAVPQIPTDVTATATLSSVTVSWDAAEDAESYEIQFDGKNIPITEESQKLRTAAALSEPARMAKTFFGLKPDTEHTYCVRAGSQGGFSEYSPLGTIKTCSSQESTLPAGKLNKTYPAGKLPHTGLDPVDPVTGAFLWSHTLLESYGKDALHFTLMYNSQGEVPVEILGKKWTHAFQYYLYMKGEKAYFGTPYGEFVSFIREGEEGSFQPAQKTPSGYSMNQMEDGTYQIREEDGTEYLFDENLALSKIMEGGLVTYQFHADEEGRIILTEGRHGGILKFTYADERVSSVADALGNTVQFTYEEDKLTQVTDSEGNTISFTYDSQNWLLEITDASGTAYLANQYDASGRVVSQSIAGRGESTAAYDVESRTTAFTDELGNEIRYHYDENQHITSIEQAGRCLCNSYNERGQLAQQRDALGNTTQMLYDKKGRMNCVIHPDGTREQISYNEAGYPVSLINRDGAESLYSYDERNNLISAQDERGNTCTYAYDDRDNLISYTDREGNIWTYAYDEAGHLKQAKDPEGNISLYSHDKGGRLISYTSPEGRTTSYAYSGTGDLLCITDADGTIRYTYDRNGNPAGITDRKGNSAGFAYNGMGQLTLSSGFMGEEYRYAYDEKGRLVKETDPNGYSVSYAYDALGRCTSLTDKNGGVTHYAYDGAGRLKQVLDAAGGTVKYVYDEAGRVTAVTDPLDHQTGYAYDRAGRLTKTTDPLGHSVSYAYDGAGNLLTRTDEEGAATVFTYDRENRLLSIRNEAGTTSFAYDRSGRLVSVLDAEGNRQEGSYDRDGFLTALTDKEGRQTAYVYDQSGRLREKTAPDGGKTSYSYDKNGNCTGITDPEGNEYAYAYDAGSRLVKVTDPLGQETHYAYDIRGQLISITDARGGRKEFAYDGNGNLTRETNPLGGEKTYEYDSLNRLARRTDEEGNQSSYAYDAAGNLTAYTDAAGNTWTYAYDACGHLTSVTDQNEDALTYEYTPAGRLSKVTDKEGAQTSYAYDAAGRLTCLSDALGNSVSFTYDSLGRMLARTDALGNTTEYEYSPAGNLLRLKDPEGGITSYTYDALGRMLTKTDALGGTTSYTYDLSGRVSTLTDPAGGQTSFTYTPAGQIASAVNAEGGTTLYAYDGNGNLVRTTDPAGTVTEYEYDAMNNQIRECLNASGEQACTTLYQYDRKGQRIKEISPLKEEKAYTYDGNGNLTSILDEEQNQTAIRYDLNSQPVFMGYGGGKEALFRYNKRGELVEIRDWTGTAVMERDKLGRLTKVTDPEGRTTGYAYDAAGNLTGTTYPDGSGTAYAYDRNRRLTKVTDPEGKTSRYAYDAAGRITALTQPGSRSSYAYNAAGLPVRAGYRLEDGTVLEEQLSYDAMGRITSAERTGSSPVLAAAAAYTYDPAGRLLSHTRGGTRESYTYDGAGNRTEKRIDGALKTAYTYNAANQLTALTENGKDYTYRYDRRGNLTEEQRSGIPIRRYAYDPAGHMTSGANLENGEKTQYTYNALGMRTSLTQTLLGKDAFKIRKVSCLPDYLSPTANDLMTYEQGFGATRTIYGNGYTRLSQKVTAFGTDTGEAGNGAGAMPPETLIGAEVIGKTYFQPDIYGSPLFASNEQGQVLCYAERNIWGGLKPPVHNDLNISGMEDSLRFTTYAYDPVIGKYFAQARFYDSRQGRMLSKDPVKRDINGYPYCNNDPVNCVDPTGEVANVLVGGAIGGLVGGAFGFANSAVSQLMSGKGFDSGKAWGAAFNGAIVGAVKGAVAGSGVGLPLAIAADFTAGAIGSAVEQGISEGAVDVGKSIAGGLTNAVNGLIYGNDTLRSLKEAAVKGAASGALTSGINYLADVMRPQPAARRSPGIQYQGGAAGMLRPRDPKKGCVPSDPTIGSLRYGKDYGYQYNVPVSNEDEQSRRCFSLWDFGKEMLTGAVTGGMAGAAFYGAGRAVSALKESIRNLRNPKPMIPMDLQFFAEDGNKGSLASVNNNRADYYIKPNGDAVPAVGYRYMPRDAGYIPTLKNTMEIPARADGTYISFNKFNTPAPEMLQVPHDASIRGSFDTLQIIDDIRIPNGKWGEASWLEPITKAYPQYGAGGATQAITNQKIKLDSLIDLLK